MPSNDKPISLYTSPLTVEQAEKLRLILEAEGFEFEPKPYTLFYAVRPKLNVAVYEKGPKVVLQGKGTQDFVTFRLEPEVLGEARLGYEEVHNPEMFTPHFGIDESGKGDFFGPLVIAGVYVDRNIALSLRKAGIQDSKRITSDARIRALARIILETPGAVYDVVMIGPERYNQLIEKFGNVNKLLAWGHARVIENLAGMRPDCPRALSDQFANPRLIENALKKRGQSILLEQRTKAESDPAVAAASILAREKFIGWFDRAEKEFGMRLPRGASGNVKQIAKDLIAAHSAQVIEKVAKTHFKTASELEK
jgi:ribonuclease HIII